MGRGTGILTCDSEEGRTDKTEVCRRWRSNVCITVVGQTGRRSAGDGVAIVLCHVFVFRALREALSASANSWSI